MKKILITGSDSYIGTSFEEWLIKHPSSYSIDTVDMKNDSWEKAGFHKYDVVFHVAGIAHISSKPKLKDIYYKVNCDLAVATAEHAKKAGVKQFIFVSSIAVYDGSSKKAIDRDTMPMPSSFYGDSKLKAEERIKPLESNEFKVVIVRPPMVYGKDSKGNYPKLAKAARKLPVFPDIHNKRSMIHIDNLCEFIKLIIDNEESGLFFPQNREYVRTSEMVRLIAEIHNNNIRLVKIFNPILTVLKSKIVNKVFGDLIYDKSMSYYEKGDYQIRDLGESIILSEK